MNKKNKNEKYVKDFVEWQNNQYLPGYYTGGKFHPEIKYGNRKLLGVVWLMVAIFIVLCFLGVVMNLDRFSLNFLPFFIFPLFLLVYSIIFVFKFLFKKKK